MNGYSSSKGSFIIDATLGRQTNFGIYVDDEEDHLIKEVSFTDYKGTIYGPYTSMSSLYDIINLKTVNFPVGEAPPFDDVRIQIYRSLPGHANNSFLNDCVTVLQNT